MTKTKVKEILAKNDFNIISESGDIEFGKYTPLGEDWFETLPWADADKFVEELEEMVNNFDVDEEVEPFIEMRGKNGVPESITDLLEDAKWKKKQLTELLAEIKANPSKELTKEQKDEFFKHYNSCGDLAALESLDKIIKDGNFGEEIEELSYCVLRLNYMNDIVECESWETFQNHDSQITDLYFDMKRELCDAVGITDEDWEYYTGC